MKSFGAFSATMQTIKYAGKKSNKMTAEEFKKLTNEYFEAAQKFVEENKKERGVIVMTTYEKTDSGSATRGICATPVIAAGMIGSAKKDDDLKPLFLLVDMIEKLGL